MYKLIPEEVVEFVYSARLASVPEAETVEFIAKCNQEAEPGEPKLIQRVVRQNVGGHKHDFSNLSADLYDNGELLMRYGSDRAEGVRIINPREPVTEQLESLKSHLEREYGAEFLCPDIDL